MRTLVTSAQMRAIEAAAFQRRAATGLGLMERAGHGAVAALLAAWPGLAERPGRALVLAGPGNNGGDGFVVARLLHARGWQVEVLLFGNPEALPDDAATNRNSWAGIGATEGLSRDGVAAALARGAPELIVDAVFGTGLRRPVAGELAAALADVAAARGAAKVVALDMPSGLCADSGRVLHAAEEPAFAPIPADLTVTFQSEKLGHRLAEGPGYCGALAVADLGLGEDAPAPDIVRLAALMPERLAKGGGGHKYAHGHALVVAGGPGAGGAARLAARGALRIGAGLVTVACPPAALQENAARLDAIMLRPVRDASALAALLADRRLNALGLGPGLGRGEATRAAVGAALAAGRATVLDADALTAFSEAPGDLFGALHPGCVLTPHGGEFAQIFPDLAAALSEAHETGPAWSRIDAARAAAGRAGCVVLLKGPDTVIAAPDGQAVVNPAHYDRAAPWLATAGAGDVLTGLVTGMLARGAAPLAAAETAAAVHLEAALAVGPGLIAEDLPEALPGVLRRLAAARP